MFGRRTIAPETARALLPATLVVLLGVALTVATTWVSWQTDDQRLRNAIERRVETHTRALEHGVATRLHQVEIMRSLFTASEAVSEQEFGTFIDNLGMRWGSITALAWIPSESIRDGKVRLGHCAPAESCSDVFVSALTASTELHHALERAKLEMQTVVSAAVALPGGAASEYSLVIAPVFRSDATTSGRQIKGFALGVLVIADLLEVILGKQTVPSGLDIFFYQGRDDSIGQLLYYHPTRTTGEARPPFSLEELLRSRHYRRRFPVADRVWTILFRPDPGTLAELRTFEPWVVLGSGLLITFLLATYITANLRRTARIEAIVAARTKELHATNVLLSEAKEQAEQANRAKTRFLAAASHDLRQPLQALNLFVNVLSGRDHDRKTREIIEHIGESTLALENLLNALLDISKLDAGLIVPEIGDVWVDELFARLENQFAPLASAKGLRLKTRSLPLVLRTDPTLIEDIMRNLIANAVRYTRKGQVVLRCHERGNSAVLSVEDTGPGIPEDQHDTVFQEFSRLGREAGSGAGASEEGLGLGLAIVDRLARLLGHRVEIASLPKRGAVFTVEIQLSDGRGERGGAEKASELGKGAAARVLVIDDEPDVLLAMRVQLENWGYPVQTASSLEQALALVQPGEPAVDLILADYRLGDGVTGDQAIRDIRDRLGRDVPALLITGDTAPDQLREAQSSGFRFLHKPVPPAKLYRAMVEALAADS